MSRRTPITVDEARARPTIRADEAAYLLGVSTDAVYRAAETGQLPALRVGRRVLIPTARLLELLGAAPAQEAS